MAALGAPLAALAGTGVVDLWRAYRRGGRAAWLLPAAIAADAAWTAYLLARRISFLPWLLPLTLTLAAAGITALLLARTGGRERGRLAVAGPAGARAGAARAPGGRGRRPL